MNNLIEIHVITFNEEKTILDFIVFYRNNLPDVRIIAHDNESTDNTVHILKTFNCEVIPFSTDGKMDEFTLMGIRNNCWKDSTAKWIIVVDSDEFVQITPEQLTDDFNIIKCAGFEIFGEGEIFEELLYGVESVGYSKPAIFKREDFVEINYAPGNHTCSPQPVEGKEIKWCQKEIRLYHTKWRSWENGINKAKEIAPRVSEESKLFGWNFHYSLDDSIHKDYYENGLKLRRLVR
jgi:glycosyltransferase involved in cell wall biosynthesis